MKVYSPGNRVGKFKILYEVLVDGRERPMVQALMALCEVLMFGEHESGRGNEYTAVSDLFQPLSEGEEIPSYRIEYAYDRAFDNTEFEERRTNHGPFGFVAIRQQILRVPTLDFNHMVNSTHHQIKENLDGQSTSLV